MIRPQIAYSRLTLPWFEMLHATGISRGPVFHPELIRGTSLSQNIDRHSKTLIDSIIELLLNDITRYYDRLVSTAVSVSEIAYDLGFEYPQYFSKMFKKTRDEPG